MKCAVLLFLCFRIVCFGGRAAFQQRLQFRGEPLCLVLAPVAYAVQVDAAAGIVVYLHHQLDVLAQRVGNLVTRGVVCHSGCNTLEDLYEERCPLYEKYADLMVDFTGCTVESAMKSC